MLSHWLSLCFKLETSIWGWVSYRQNTWVWATKWVEVEWHLLLQYLTTQLQMILFPMCVGYSVLILEDLLSHFLPCYIALQTVSFGLPHWLVSQSSKGTAQAGKQKPEERGSRAFLPHYVCQRLLFPIIWLLSSDPHLSSSITELKYTVSPLYPFKPRGGICFLLCVSLCAPQHPPLGPNPALPSVSGPPPKSLLLNQVSWIQFPSGIQTGILFL